MNACLLIDILEILIKLKDVKPTVSRKVIVPVTIRSDQLYVLPQLTLAGPIRICIVSSKASTRLGVCWLCGRYGYRGRINLSQPDLCLSGLEE